MREGSDTGDPRGLSEQRLGAAPQMRGLLPDAKGPLVGNWVPAPTPLLAYRGWVAGLPLPFIDATGALNVLRGRM